MRSDLTAVAPGNTRRPQKGSPGPLLGSFHKQMNMVGGDRIVQHTHAVALLRLEKPVNPPPPIPRKLQQELLLVAPACNVPDVLGKKVSIGSRH